MSTANTFGTFLDTLKTLETKTQQRAPTAEPNVFTIAELLKTNNGSASLKDLRSRLNVSGEALLSAMTAGREKGLFELDDTPAEPVLKLTKLGRSLVE